MLEKKPDFSFIPWDQGSMIAPLVRKAGEKTTMAILQVAVRTQP
jgi:hypothetical protein